MHHRAEAHWRGRALVAVALAGLLAACGGGDTPPIEVQILEPTDSGAYTQSAQEVRLGGSIARASFLHVDNLTTGTRSDGYVTYFDGQGSWLADVYGLALGPNTLEAVADSDGTGRLTARDRIVVTRTLP